MEKMTVNEQVNSAIVVEIRPYGTDGMTGTAVGESFSILKNHILAF